MATSKSRQASPAEATKKQKMTGSEPLVNEIGSRELHKKHSVGFEDADNGFLRLRIKDQLFVDKLLLDDHIDTDQHKEAERILGIAQSANVYIKSPNMEAVASEGGKPEMMTSGLMRLRGILKAIQKKHGDIGVEVLYRHVIEDEWTDNQDRINILSAVLTRD